MEDGKSHISRQAEAEPMEIAEEALAYAVADFSDVNAAFVERLAEWVGPVEQATAIDLGTGPGDIPVRVVRRYPGWRVVAADLSEAMLGHARRTIEEAALTEAIQLVLQDAKGAPFRNGAFDVVFANSILHHISDTQALWAEVRRLGRSGAWVLLRDLARPGSSAAAAAIVQQYAGHESMLLREEFYRSLLAAYTPDEVREQLREAGLETLHVAAVSDRHLDVFGRLG